LVLDGSAGPTTSQNGNGSGDILWKLGYQGDFALVGATYPIDWFYAQHAPKILSPNSTGVFSLALIDNGNGRVLDTQGHQCGTPGQIPCYTRTAIFEIDEKAKTASITWQDTLSLFSVFGGYVQQLGNSDIEFSISDTSMSPPSSAVLEVTRTV
jgi:arylsulfate sulfotransferase